MAIVEEFFARGSSGGHAVQFYGSDERALVDNVSRYLRAGLDRGETAVIVAVPEHAQAFLEDLRRHGYDVDALDGRLKVADAREMLDRYMIDGHPDAARFDAVVGSLVREMRARGTGLRAYGEMVGLLWGAGEFPAAIRLEQLWHGLMKTVDFKLFCAYAIDVFDPESEAGAVDALLCAHTHLLSGADDDLHEAVSRAIHEVIGHGDTSPLAQRAHPERWPKMEAGESAILWLRKHHPERAAEVLSRARTYLETAS